MSGNYFYPIKREFLNLSGGTVTGDTVFSTGLYANNLSGGTLYSGSTDVSDVIYNVASSLTNSAQYLPISGGTGGPYNLTGSTTASTIYVGDLIEPTTDNLVDVGSTFKRFRSLNVVNGIAVNFTATTRVTTPEIVLGTTTMTENNIILSGYTLDGGAW